MKNSTETTIAEMSAEELCETVAITLLTLFHVANRKLEAEEGRAFTGVVIAREAVFRLVNSFGDAFNAPKDSLEPILLMLATSPTLKNNREDSKKQERPIVVNVNYDYSKYNN